MNAPAHRLSTPRLRAPAVLVTILIPVFLLLLGGFVLYPTLAAQPVASPPDENNAAQVSASAARPAKPSELTPEALGDLLVIEKHYLEAIRQYELVPVRSAVVWNKLGIAYHHMYALGEAKKDYEKAVALDPRYSDAWNNLGTIAYAQKDYHRAEKLYKKALKLNPQAAATYSNLGTVYIIEGKQKRGAEAYHRALSLDSTAFDHNSPRSIEEQGSVHDRARMNYYLATTYAQIGRKEDALRALRMALSEGFADRKRLAQDKSFASLRDMPEFQQLLAPPQKR